MTATDRSSDADQWFQRDRKWRRKLHRLRFDAEPLQQQVEKYRKATIVLTIVPAIIGLMFVAIFTAFGRPDIGLVGIAVLFVPVLSWAWFDFWLLQKRVRAYEAEKSKALAHSAIH